MLEAPVFQRSAPEPENGPTNHHFAWQLRMDITGPVETDARCIFDEGNSSQLIESSVLSLWQFLNRIYVQAIDKVIFRDAN